MLDTRTRHDEIVGRAELLGRLLEARHHSRRAGLTCHVVTGEPKVGRTALLTQVCRATQSHPGPSVHIACSRHANRLFAALTDGLLRQAADRRHAEAERAASRLRADVRPGGTRVRKPDEECVLSRLPGPGGGVDPRHPHGHRAGRRRPGDPHLARPAAARPAGRRTPAGDARRLDPERRTGRRADRTRRSVAGRRHHHPAGSVGAGDRRRAVRAAAPPVRCRLRRDVSPSHRRKPVPGRRGVRLDPGTGAPGGRAWPSCGRP